MKSLFKKTMLFLSFTLLSVAVWAQDKKIDVDINLNKKDNWYQQPWAWIVGAAVFILILVAILRPRQKAS
jgi:uncharacterized membrane protein YcjF (UPF0283 family)